MGNYKRATIIKDQFGNKITVTYDVQYKQLTLLNHPPFGGINIETNHELEILIKVLTNFKDKLNDEYIDWAKIADKEFSETIENLKNDLKKKG